MPSRTRQPRLATAAVLVFAGVALLTACTDDTAAQNDPSTLPPAGETSQPAETATLGPTEFVDPASCDALTSDDLRATFEADGLELLGGPGSRYGEDPAALAESFGGITCQWGVDGDIATSVSLAVTPLDATNRPTIEQGLEQQGLQGVDTDGVTLYGVRGVEGEADQFAQLNMLRDDSWIAVVLGEGGDDAFARAEEYAADVTASVYR
jgi:hypothetical protein